MLRAASLEVDRLRESCELLRAEVIEAEERERRAMDLLEAKDAAGTVADRNRSGLLQRIRFTTVTFLSLLGQGARGQRAAPGGSAAARVLRPAAPAGRGRSAQAARTVRSTLLT